MVRIGKDQRNDPRNRTKWLEFSASFVLASCRFVDRIVLPAELRGQEFDLN
jgi:hypothetical protein